MEKKIVSEDVKIAASQLIREKEYWQKQLAGELEKCYFFYDFPKTKNDKRTTAEIAFRLEGEIYRRLTGLCAGSDPKLHMVLTAAVVALLNRYSGNSDIILGTSIDKQDVEEELINTVLPLRVRVTREMGFKDILLATKKTVDEAIKHQNYPVENQVPGLELDVSVILENIQDKKYLRHTYPSVLFIFNRTEEEIKGILEYDTSVYRRETVEGILLHFTKLLQETIFDVQEPIGEPDLRSEREKKQAQRFNETEEDYPAHLPLNGLVEAQAEKTPGRTAVRQGNLELTYRELNRKADRFAAKLFEKGIRKGDIVGIYSERSIAMVTAVLGIMKAGAAYLPIDVGYPKERKKYILEDSGINLVLTGETVNVDLEWNGQVAAINELLEEDALMERIPVDVAPGDLAYIIYTSGSTGRPKGVMIEHRSLVNYITWAARRYAGGELANFPLYTSISFDLTVTSLFTPLITGNCVEIYEGSLGEVLIERVIRENNVEVIKLTPAHLRLLKSEHIDWSESAIRRFIVGGEMLETPLAREINEALGGKVEIFNEYGPTEATVGCMIHRYNPGEDDGPSVPIGKPAANTEIYLLDQSLKPVIGGAPGELYIAGNGIARGYLNQPELTGDRFVKIPGMGGSRMYKTGDRARWLPNGNLEFLGRKDEQVKIKGFRIEPGEIENRLMKHPEIREAVVVARKAPGAGEDHDFQLCAYITVNRSTDLPQSVLREFLAESLPEYMIPTHFVKLEEIPLTTNGKVDRKALPEPDGNIDTGVRYRPPGNTIEQLLVTIWEEVLGVEKIGIDDSYFVLGGDSIRAIQIAARLQNMDYKLELKHLFQYPTIAELSGYVRKLENDVPQEPVDGTIPLTPVQHWFFEKKFTDQHHFNQAVMLHNREFKEEWVRKAFTEIVRHHDALRIVFRAEEGSERIRQYNRGVGNITVDLAVYDFTDRDTFETDIREKANLIQRSIDLLGEDNLVKLGLFNTKKGDYLLIVIHHHVIDGVSWRILFEDFANAYKALEKGKTVEFPGKTLSYKSWAEKLLQYAREPRFLKQIDYWGQLEKHRYLPLPGKATENNAVNEGDARTKYRVKDSKRESTALSKEKTEQLLKEVNKTYNTEVNDILLTALGLALNRWAGLDAVLIDLEGHGREEIIDRVDVNRTVGWFTTQYPVAIKIQEPAEISDTVKQTKEMLRKVPNKGIGYWIFKYLTDDYYRNRPAFRLIPEVSFNYLGQFDRDVDTETFQIADIAPGDQISPESERFYTLDIIAMVTGGTLKISVGYNNGQYRAEQVAEFVNSYRESLNDCIRHCMEKTDTEFTASDLSSSDFNEEEIDSIFDELEETFNN